MRAQQPIQFQLIDNETNNPVIGAQVLLFPGKTVFYANDKGSIIISETMKWDSLFCTAIGYNSRSLLRDEITPGYTIRLSPKATLLDEVVVIGRTNVAARNYAGQLAVIDQSKVELLQSQNTADLLEQSGQVFVQKSQMGGGSPVLRGFEANKVLLVVDGVRLNNAIYRNGHLQNAITVDGSSLEQLEVIFGPGALIYGSDALGGVVHFRTRQPEFNKHSGKTSYTFQSANTGHNTSLQYAYGQSKWATFTSIGYSDFGDLKSGQREVGLFPEFGHRRYYVERFDQRDSVISNSKPNKQIGTAYGQFDLLHKWRFDLHKNWELGLNFQYSTSSDVPRYDRLTDSIESNADLEYAEWYYGPQRRLLSALHIQSHQSAWWDRAHLNVSFQKVKESRHSRLFQNPWRNSQVEDVDIYGVSLDIQQQFAPLHANVSYGLDYHFNTVSSNAYNQHIETSALDKQVDTRYPGGANNTTAFSAYAKLDNQHKNKGFRYALGLRYSLYSLFSRFENLGNIVWPDNLLDGLRATNDALIGSLELGYKTSNDWMPYLVISSAFHAPNIDDFAKIRIKNDFVNIPNTTLKPEYTWNFESGATKRWVGPSIRFQATSLIYYTRLFDAIVRANFRTLDGDTLLVLDDRPRRVQANINAEEAYIWGLSLQGKALYKDRWQFEAGLNYTRGRQVDGSEKIPLAHIPPLHGMVSAGYQTDRIRLQTNILFNGRKGIEEYAIGSSDNEDKATPTGSLGWSTVNFYSSWAVLKSLKLTFNVENVLDTNYRTFSSGVNAPGRNFILGLSKTFE